MYVERIIGKCDPMRPLVQVMRYETLEGANDEKEADKIYLLTAIFFGLDSISLMQK